MVGLFDPEVPDYARYPAMKDVAAYADEILPGEMLIIPPDWWHYTRNQEHSVTLSHNFINHLNVSSFMACVSQALRNDPENRGRFETVRRSIEQAGETGTEGGGVRH